MFCSCILTTITDKFIQKTNDESRHASWWTNTVVNFKKQIDNINSQIIRYILTCSIRFFVGTTLENHKLNQTLFLIKLTIGYNL